MFCGTRNAIITLENGTRLSPCAKCSKPVVYATTLLAGLGLYPIESWHCPRCGTSNEGAHCFVCGTKSG